MPAIVTGTVVKWEVVDEDSKDARMKYVECSQPITVYVAGGDEDDEVGSAIISAYILGQKNKDELLQAARDGLLQVVGIRRSPVTPPAVP